MTLPAPTRRNPLRSFRPANLTRRNPASRLTEPAGTEMPFSSREAARRQHILMVVFTSPDGCIWQAIGGGDILAEAVAFARDSCPADATWRPISWSDLDDD